MTGNYDFYTEELAASIAAFIEANIGAVLMGLLITCGILIIWSIIAIVGNWRMLEKAGEQGWWCLIPLLGGHVAYKIAWHPFFYWIGAILYFATEVLNTLSRSNSVNIPYLGLILLAILILSIFLNVVYNLKLSRAFGHGVGFAVGLILLPMIFIPILGFGKSVYEGKIR